MPTWSTNLPKNRKHMGFDLRRTPADKPLLGIVTSDNILVTDTHYWGGRTIPCERPDCEACNQSVPYRTHVYVSVFDPKTNEHFLFECTANAAKAFVDYREAAGTTRGCFFHASRPKGTKNGKVAILTKPSDPTKTNLPSPPNVALALCVIWRLPLTGFAIEHTHKGDPVTRPKANELQKVHEQPDNQPDPPTIGEVIAGNGRKLRPKVHA
jgi:hypothetical protein